jgi:hypothetical protein
MPCYKTLNQTKAQLNSFQLVHKLSFNLIENKDVSILVNENDEKINENLKF